MESEGNEEKKENLMKIWSSGRRSDEQQVIIRTKTLFVDVILAFPPPIFSLPYFLKYWIYIFHVEVFPFLFHQRGHDAEVYTMVENERINRDFIYFIYDYILGISRTIEQSAFYWAKTVIVSEFSERIWALLDGIF